MLYCLCQAADESTGASLWSVAHQLTAVSDGLEAFLDCGAVLRLLGCIFGVRGYASFYKNREDSALLLSKLLLHPHQGVDTASTLKQFLPSPVVLLLRSRGGGVKILDQCVENPELIWTKEMKAELRDVLSQLLNDKLAAQLSREQKQSQPAAGSGGSEEQSPVLAAGKGGVPHGLPPPEALLLPSLPPAYTLCYARLAQEISVGNVYLKHFLKQPTFRTSFYGLFFV